MPVDPAAQQVVDDSEAEEDDPALIQEQPWTEAEAFQLTGVAQSIWSSTMERAVNLFFT